MKLFQIQIIKIKKVVDIYMWLISEKVKNYIQSLIYTIYVNIIHTISYKFQIIIISITLYIDINKEQ